MSGSIRMILVQDLLSSRVECAHPFLNMAGENLKSIFESNVTEDETMLLFYDLVSKVV